MHVIKTRAQRAPAGIAHLVSRQRAGVLPYCQDAPVGKGHRIRDRPGGVLGQDVGVVDARDHASSCFSDTLHGDRAVFVTTC